MYSRTGPRTLAPDNPHRVGRSAEEGYPLFVVVRRRDFGSRLETKGAYIELSRRWRSLTTAEKCRYLELLDAMARREGRS